MMMITLLKTKRVCEVHGLNVVTACGQKFQPGCWAASSSFANCMVTGHVSCVTVISVCLCAC